jgi:tRNA pseudouridine38-40 synthase
MVRTLVGTMVETGQGRRTVEEFVELLSGSSRLSAGPTAPAHGLFLWDVSYRRSP